jgi:hypothetical protein
VWLAGIFGPSGADCAGQSWTTRCCVTHLLSLFDGRVGLISTALLIASAIVAGPVGRWLRRPGWAVLVGAATVVLLVATTVANRGWVRSSGSIGDQLTWWTRNWAELPGAVTDPGWWLNVVLFAPAAAVWAWLVRRPTVIALVLIGASFAIETMQATVMTGIDDIADFVANSIGVVAGWALGRAALTRLGDGAPACPTAPVAQPSRRSTRRE